MFDRFLRFAEARRALRQGRFEQALKSLDDPRVRDDRRAADLRSKAHAGLLARARQRLAEGKIEAAQQETGFLLSVDKENQEAKELLQQCRSALLQKKVAATEADSLQTLVRQSVAAGQLRQAEQTLQVSEASAIDALEKESIKRSIQGRRAMAGQEVLRGGHALRNDQPAAALEHARAALALDADLDAAKEVMAQARVRLATEAAARIRQYLAEGDLGAAANAVRDAEDVPPDALEAVQLEFMTALNAALDTFDLDRLRQLVEVGESLRGRTVKPLFATADALLAVLDAEHNGDLERAVSGLLELMKSTENEALQQYLARLREASDYLSNRWQQAKAKTIAGDLVGARQALAEITERYPRHEVARRELAVLDQNTDERVRQLAQVRATAAAGRLREAQQLALLIVVPGPAGEEVRWTMKDMQHRMDLVDAGLDQIRRTLHGRDSSSGTGLRQCLARLEQLALVQNDHLELNQMRAGLLAEIEGLAALDDLQASAARGDQAAVQAAVETFLTAVPRLVYKSRLEARRLEAIDRLEARIRGELDAARAGAGAAYATILRKLCEGVTASEQRAVDLEQRCSQRLNASEDAARQGLLALAAKDLETAASCLVTAQQAATDAPSTLALEDALRRVERQAATLDQVSSLTNAGDHEEAVRRLAHMHQTPPLLRTRIFDLKQRLARAQGLDQSFLLRVDDGGEFLVLRGDSILIGNLRDGSADLPVLAAIAGRHARIQRTISFHGGARETIVAERGTIAVNGQPACEHTLAHGDLVRLGTSLDLLYEMPSRRSLCARLTLKGGFRTGGTDKVLLLKDRGRDGRILIGPARDAHVRIAAAQTEIELFAHKDGQIRVRLDGSGTMDGKEFSGEHPVTPGAMIHAGGVSFLLLPLAATA